MAPQPGGGEPPPQRLSLSDRLKMISTTVVFLTGRGHEVHVPGRGRGRFLVTASASSFLSELLSVGCAVTKSAAYAFAKGLAFSYRSRGIAVSAIVPGPVWTPLLDAAPYLHPLANPADLAVERIFEQLREGRFLITTHPTLPPCASRSCNEVRFHGRPRKRADAVAPLTNPFNVSL